MPQPILSIGMIVKNEIRCIEKCLKALQPLRDAIPCELIIADTGSTDGTRAVAEQYADVVFDFEWIDDFAAARNAVLDRCSGQWYLSVDADEYLRPQIEQLVDMVHNPDYKDVDFVYVIIRNYYNRDFTGVYHDFPGGRILNRQKANIRYAGAIHECFDFPYVVRTETLDQIIFDHDGYAFLNHEDLVRKRERNMRLLRKEYEKDPKNLRRLNQCLESADIFPDEVKKYVYDGMETVKDETLMFWHQYAPAICRTCLAIALKYHYPEFEEWLKWASEHVGNNLFFNIDVSHQAACYFYKEKKYTHALRYAEHYLKSYREVEKKDKDEIFRSTSVSILKFTDEKFKMLTECIKGSCLASIGFLQEATGVFVHIQRRRYDASSNVEYFKLAELVASIPEAQEKIAQVIVEIQEDKSPENDVQRKWLLQWIKQNLVHKEHSAILSKVSGEIGISAQIISGEKEDVTQLWNGITTWTWIAPTAIYKAMSYGLPFPQAFYEQTRAEQIEVIKGLVKTKYDQKLEIISEWLHIQSESDSIPQLYVGYEMAIRVLAMIKWDAIEDKYSLCNGFLQVGEKYLSKLYSSDIVEQPQLWKLLPPTHEVILVIAQGMCLLHSGDKLGWVKSLQKALQIAPETQKMVQFLMEQSVETEESRELRELADKVKALLSQYPEDDPAVLAMKQSPIYEKVAHLIEC